MPQAKRGRKQEEEEVESQEPEENGDDEEFVDDDEGLDEEQAGQIADELDEEVSLQVFSNTVRITIPRDGNEDKTLKALAQAVKGLD